MTTPLLPAGLLAALLAMVACASAAERTVPAPRPDHPGNVFLEGEAVAVPVAADDGTAWRAVDYDGKTVADGKVAGGRATLGPRPVGWYEVRWGDGPEERLSAGVLARLKVPTSVTSPIALDVATAWFYKEAQMPAVANLCTLAGVNWVRDRLAWGAVEPKKGELAGPTIYDASARIQAEADLQVLQVNHSSPPWANPNGKRFPLDLRDAYRFHREMAKRWAGQVLAFEPWNEADIEVFGGHTGAEMASLQKASYLGLKAGGAKVTACLNVFAVPQKAILDDLHANEAWPYFDTFNLHHYAPTDQYPGIYATFRAASAGRPMWVTEFARPVQWSDDEKAKEPSPADLKVQAERVAQVFAASLFEGPEACFYFLLPHYSEGRTQFGIIRPDLTPRPAYVALAAVGRLLADARPVGRLKGTAAKVRGFVFRAKPDGQDREVLVAWATDGEAPLLIPAVPKAVFDHLGRPQEVSTMLVSGRDEQGHRVAGGREAGPLLLKPGPTFAVFAPGAAAKMALDPPPAAPERLGGAPSPVVMQALWPKEQVMLPRSAYRIASGKPETIPLYVYNFSDRAVEGTLAAAGPEAWRVTVPAKVTVEPQGRAGLALAVDCRGHTPSITETLRITGDFGNAGKPVLSLVVMPEPRIVPKGEIVPVPGANRADRWQPSASEGSRVRVWADGKAIRVEATMGGGDRWVYPMVTIAADAPPPADACGVQATLTLVEGDGTFRAVVREGGGGGYVADLVPQPERGKAVEAVAFFDTAVYGAGWSAPDPNGRLDVAEIRSLAIGCNVRGERMAFRIENVRWLRQ